jgi:hypothetical protein
VFDLTQQGRRQLADLGDDETTIERQKILSLNHRVLTQSCLPPFWR